MESLGNDDVSLLNTPRESLGNGDVSLKNAHKYIVGNDCDLTMTGSSSKSKIPKRVLASVTHQATSSCLCYLCFSQSFQVVYVYLACAK